MTAHATSDHHLDIDALGVTVRIDVGGLPPVDRDLLSDAWSGARTTVTRTPVAVVEPRSHFSFDQTVADLTTQVTLVALAARRGQLWMVHAGAIADDEGRVILFSGRSGMGKTTLMARLAREYGYVTDESVGILADGEVLPYRKPLSVIVDGSSAKHQLSPGSLRLRELPLEPLRLHAIVVLDRDAEHDGAPRLEPLEIADAVAALAPQCSYLAELEAPLQALIGHVEGAGGALRLRYREADAIPPLVWELFAADRLVLPHARAVAESALHDDDYEIGSATTYRRTPTLDAVTIDGARLALLRRDDDDRTTVHLIDGIGPTLWRAANNTTLDALIDAAVRVHGAPGDAGPREAVLEALHSLISAGLISEGSAASSML
ncbi:ATP-binding protein [Microbacterium trichothecenolyticum]|uniref:AAA+ ATPase domain-containing protein n=1 Tax=Microbacterium trichothecenolyticum TaxID=69370 RepID=A0ABU0TT70_MICTR|nr:ATP-binding protein [Microbacterium trichothecenolyticum]MDQ1122849.1 hypothetical protein [Microbacterium trichothecenolyticum]